MSQIAVSVDLPSEEVRYLWEVAERKRCTFEEMIEDAIAVYVGRLRERDAGEAVAQRTNP